MVWQIAGLSNHLGVKGGIAQNNHTGCLGQVQLDDHFGSDFGLGAMRAFFLGRQSRLD